MGSKSKVVAHTNMALNARTADEKLDSLARALAELADFVDDLENQLRKIERSIK